MKQAFVPIAFLLFIGCAQQVAPTGGQKDESPPIVLAEEPENQSIEFSAKEIVITFDEYVQLKNTAEQVVISPPVVPSPSFQLKKKSLAIKFEQELAKNTTYTINFGDAIRDNNEGNILKNYTYVFSTGTHLDSMQVKGKLVDAITGEPAEDILVMLYKNDVDSLPLDTFPDYFTRSTSNGIFHIKHVANQPYKIFALKDENSNYRFDVSEEKIGFLDSLISPFAPLIVTIDTLAQDSINSESLKNKKESSSISSYNIQLFVEEDTTQFLKKAYCEHFGKLVFVYNRPVSNFEIKLEGQLFKKQWLLKDYNLKRDTVTIWTTDVVPDTMNLLLSVDKADNDTVELIMKLRTAEIDISSKGKGKKNRKKKFALTAKAKLQQGRSPKPGDPLSIIWNHPIIGVELSKLKLYEDSIRVKYTIASTDSALRQFEMLYPWKKEKHYRLLILDSAFSDLFNLWNDTIETTFIGIDEKTFGEISVKVSENPSEQLVVELLNKSGIVLQSKTVSAAKVIMFTQLDPGKYDLRIIKDKNKNGKWDSGNYSEKIQPEVIRMIEQDVEVRANWEMELEWRPNQD